MAASPSLVASSSSSSWHIGNSSSTDKCDCDCDSDSDSDSSITTFISSTTSASNEHLTSDENFNGSTSPNLNPRKSRTRTVEIHSPLKHVASCEKVRRNTDSMLEDAFIADKLKRRLGSRREQTNAHRQTIAYTGLSDFIMNSIMEGSLDAISAAMPTNESLSDAANIAFHACMAGYFDNLEDEITIQKLKHLFMESLERVEFQQGEYICKQNEQVDKLFVVEEGVVQFSCGGQVAGSVGTGSILGELSLVYGLPAPSDVICITPCAILWTMDTLAYRRIQAVVAKESLIISSSTNTSNEQKKDTQIQTLRRQHSSFLDLQEESAKSAATDIKFDQLTKVAIVGKGAFGSVYIVENSNRTDRYYSLKCMSKSSIIQHGHEKRVLIEKHALQATTSSPFTISLLGTYQDKDSIYFLTDFIQGGNLMGHMINKDILPHKECVFFCASIVSGLNFLHRRGFVHRDVKPENCLIGKDGYLKLCDMGMAKRLPSTIQLPSGGTEVVTLAFTMCGTPEFIAPECVLSSGYSKGIDWWALGCILVEMYSGKSPFEFGDLKKTFKSVCLIGMGRDSFVPPEELTQPGLQDALDFAQQLLCKATDRLGRQSGHRVEDHEYFSGINFGKLEKKRIKAPYLPTITHATDTSNFSIDQDQDDDHLEPYTGRDLFQDF